MQNTVMETQQHSVSLDGSKLRTLLLLPASLSPVINGRQSRPLLLGRAGRQGIRILSRGDTQSRLLLSESCICNWVRL